MTSFTISYFKWFVHSVVTISWHFCYCKSYDLGVAQSLAKVALKMLKYLNLVKVNVFLTGKNFSLFFIIVHIVISSIWKYQNVHFKTWADLTLSFIWWDNVSIFKTVVCSSCSVIQFSVEKLVLLIYIEMNVWKHTSAIAKRIKKNASDTSMTVVVQMKRWCLLAYCLSLLFLLSYLDVEVYLRIIFLLLLETLFMIIRPVNFAFIFLFYAHIYVL